MPISKSSTESEIFALSDMLSDALWVQSLLKELVPNYNQPIRVYQNNKACITILTNEIGSYRKCKHYMIKLAWVKQWIAKGIITLHYCETSRMQADLLTKVINGSQFYELLVSVACNPHIIRDGTRCTLTELEKFNNVRAHYHESKKEKKKSTSSPISMEEEEV